MGFVREPYRNGLTFGCFNLDMHRVDGCDLNLKNTPAAPVSDATQAGDKISITAIKLSEQITESLRCGIVSAGGFLFEPRHPLEEKSSNSASSLTSFFCLGDQRFHLLQLFLGQARKMASNYGCQLALSFAGSPVPQAGIAVKRMPF